MEYEITLAFHYVAILLFGGYILLDRLLFRRYFAAEGEEAVRFYRLSGKLLAPAVAVAVVTGGLLTLLQPARLEHPFFMFKLLLVILLIGMFFYCPRFSRGHGERARRVYRAVVVVLLMCVLALSKFFI